MQTPYFGHAGLIYQVTAALLLAAGVLLLLFFWQMWAWAARTGRGYARVYRRLVRRGILPPERSAEEPAVHELLVAWRREVSANGLYISVGAVGSGAALLLVATYAPPSFWVVANVPQWLLVNTAHLTAPTYVPVCLLSLALLLRRTRARMPDAPALPLRVYRPRVLLSVWAFPAVLLVILLVWSGLVRAAPPLAAILSLAGVVACCLAAELLARRVARRLTFALHDPLLAQVLSAAWRVYYARLSYASALLLAIPIGFALLNALIEALPAAAFAPHGPIGAGILIIALTGANLLPLALIVFFSAVHDSAQPRAARLALLAAAPAR